MTTVDSNDAPRHPHWQNPKPPQLNKFKMATPDRLLVINIVHSQYQLMKTFRVHNTRSMILFFLLGLRISHRPIISSDIILISLSLICSYAFASILNFCRDRQIDAANHRRAPAGIASLQGKDLRRLLIGVAGIALFPTTLTRSPVLYAAGISAHLVLGYTYSHPSRPFSFHPLGKSISMWIGYLLLPAIMGLGLGFNITQLLTIMWISLYYASWQLFNDIKDVSGDRKFGKHTLAVILGTRKLTLVSLCISTISLYHLFRLSLYPPTTITKILSLNYLLLCSFQLLSLTMPDFITHKKNRQLAGYLLLLSLILLLFSV